MASHASHIKLGKKLREQKIALRAVRVNNLTHCPTCKREAKCQFTYLSKGMKFSFCSQTCLIDNIGSREKTPCCFVCSAKTDNGFLVNHPDITGISFYEICSLECLNSMRRFTLIQLGEDSFNYCFECGKRPNEEKFQVCSRCKVVTYCSKECAKGDWPDHKKLCTKDCKRSKITLNPESKLSDGISPDDYLKSDRYRELAELLLTADNYSSKCILCSKKDIVLGSMITRGDIIHTCLKCSTFQQIETVKGAANCKLGCSLCGGKDELSWVTIMQKRKKGNLSRVITIYRCKDCAEGITKWQESFPRCLTCNTAKMIKMAEKCSICHEAIYCDRRCRSKHREEYQKICRGAPGEKVLAEDSELAAERSEELEDIQPAPESIASQGAGANANEDARSSYDPDEVD